MHVPNFSIIFDIPKVLFHKEFSDYRKLKLCVCIVVNMKFSVSFLLQQTLDSYQYNMALAIKIFETKLRKINLNKKESEKEALI